MALRISDALGSIKLRLTLAAIAAMATGVALSTVLLVRQAERDMLERQREQQLGRWWTWRATCRRGWSSARRRCA